MQDNVQEPIFAVLLIFASGLALTAYMLGVLLDPVSAVVISIVLVGIGVAFFIPDGEQAMAAIISLLAVSLAGVGIPRLVAEFTTVRDEMGVTLALSGLVLLLTIAFLRLTVFGRRTQQPS